MGGTNNNGQGGWLPLLMYLGLAWIAASIPHVLGGRVKFLLLMAMVLMALVFLLVLMRQGKAVYFLHLALGGSLILNPNVFLGAPDLTHFGGASGLFISLTDLVLFSLLFLHASRALAHGRGRGPGVPWTLTLALFFYFAAQFMSMPGALNLSLARAQVFLEMKCVLLLLYVGFWSDYRAPEPSSHPMFVGVALAVLVETLIVVAESRNLIPANFSLLGMQIGGIEESLRGALVNRVGGTYRHPNYLAVPMACLIVPFWALFLGTKKPIRYVHAAAMGGAMLCLVLSLSRGGWVSLAMILCMFLGFLLLSPGSMDMLRRFAKPLLAGMGIMLLILAVFSNLIYAKLFHSDPMNVHSRVELNEMAVEMIAERPLFGFGLNNHSEAAKNFGNFAVYAQAFGLPPVVHNIYLLIASEIGLVGLAAFLAMAGLVMIRAVKALRGHGPVGDKIPMASFMAGALGFLAADMFAPSLRKIEITYLFWWFLGVVILLARQSRESAQQAGEAGE